MALMLANWWMPIGLLANDRLLSSMDYSKGPQGSGVTGGVLTHCVRPLYQPCTAIRLLQFPGSWFFIGVQGLTIGQPTDSLPSGADKTFAGLTNQKRLGQTSFVLQDLRFNLRTRSRQATGIVHHLTDHLQGDASACGIHRSNVSLRAEAD